MSVPVRDGTGGPVRVSVGYDGTELWDAVGVLDADLDPVLLIAAEEDPGLIELLGEPRGDGHLVSGSRGERSEKIVLGTVDARREEVCTLRIDSNPN